MNLESPPSNAKLAAWSARTANGDQKLGFVFWRSGKWVLGFLNRFPDHWTQGRSLKDLKIHLLDIFNTCVLEERNPE